jgi:hypothetical protein
VDGDIERYKVAKGGASTYKIGISFNDKLSPVIKPLTIRADILSRLISGYLYWLINSATLYIKCFSTCLDEQLYTQQALRFIDPTRPSYVCKLLKSLYGLKQASKAGLKKLSDLLKRYRFSASKEALPYYRSYGGKSNSIYACIC